MAVVELFAGAPTVPDRSRERLVASAVGELAHVFERELAAPAAGGGTPRRAASGEAPA